MGRPGLAPGSQSSYSWHDDPFRGWRAATYLTLFVLAALAWWVTDDRVDDMGMSMGPGTIAFFMGTWVVMMAAMMFPSVAPMVATYVSIQRGRIARRMPAPAGAALFFVAGYLLSWSAAGLLCYVVLWLGDQLASDPMFWQDDG